jgi:hypothetical protein
MEWLICLRSLLEWKKFWTAAQKSPPNNIPGVPEEEGRVTIRVGSFVIPNTEDCLPNVLM